MEFLALFRYQLAIFLALTVASGVLIVSHENDGAFLVHIALIYICSAFILLVWVLALTYKKFSDSAGEYDDIVALLLDIRNGTKNFYKEKREYSRIKCGMKALLNTGETDKPVGVTDVSYRGALLRTDSSPNEGQKNVGLKLYLPIFSQPIDIEAVVIRIVPVGTDEQQPEFNIGVKFTGISKSDRDKLAEALNILSRQSRK